jgi:flagellar protein FliO/FliZ
MEKSPGMLLSLEIFLLSLFSLDLGGEKLKRIITILLTIFFVVMNPSLLFSQESVSPVVGEDQFIIGEDVSPNLEDQFVIGEVLPEDAEDPTLAGESNFSLILRMLLVLVLAAAAIYGLVYFIKKLSNPKKLEDPYLKVLSSASIGPNRAVHVISLGDKAWLVGSADNSVSLISEIDDKETIDAMLLDNSRNNANSNMGKLIDFRSIFMRFSGTPDDGQVPGNLPKSKSIEERRKRFKGF